MAISISFSPATISYQKHPPISTSIPPMLSSSITTTQFSAPRPQPSSPLHLRRPHHRHFHTNPGRCRVASPGPPPPERDPGDGKSSLQLTGIGSTLSRFQDTVRIFFAVFFWMSLFFWSSTWGGWDNDKPDKGSRFRR